MKRIFFLCLIILGSLRVSSQVSGFSARNIITDGVGFNFFTGSSAGSFSPTPKALGSGVYDLSGQYSVAYFWLFKPEVRGIGVATTVAFKLNKFRFQEHYYVDNKFDNFFVVDTVSTHYYSSSFFSRHGSKLVSGKLHFPLMFYFPVSRWFGDSKGIFGIYAGGYYDLHLFSYHKLFYGTSSGLIKNRTRNGVMKNYMRRHVFGVRLGFKLGHFFITGQRDLVSFFRNNFYELYANKLSIIYRFKFKTDKLEEKLEKFGTDA